MTSRTTTRVTHYHVQKKRRAEFIEEWRRYQKTVVPLEDVAMAGDAPRETTVRDRAAWDCGGRTEEKPA